MLIFVFDIPTQSVREACYERGLSRHRPNRSFTSPNAAPSIHRRRWRHTNRIRMAYFLGILVAEQSESGTPCITLPGFHECISSATLRHSKILAYDGSNSESSRLMPSLRRVRFARRLQRLVRRLCGSCSLARRTTCAPRRCAGQHL